MIVEEGRIQSKKEVKRGGKRIQERNELNNGPEEKQPDHEKSAGKEIPKKQKRRGRLREKRDKDNIGETNGVKWWIPDRKYKQCKTVHACYETSKNTTRKKEQSVKETQKRRIERHVTMRKIIIEMTERESKRVQNRNTNTTQIRE